MLKFVCKSNEVDGSGAETAAVEGSRTEGFLFVSSPLPLTSLTSCKKSRLNGSGDVTNQPIKILEKY